MAEQPNWNAGGWADNQSGGGYDPNNPQGAASPQITPAERTNIQTAPNWNAGGWAENESGGGYDPNTDIKQEPTADAAAEMTVTSDAVSSQQETPSGVEVSAKLPLENPLHKYASYTYNLSLHLLTVDDYNNMVDGKEYVAKNVLIASAGRWNDLTGANAFNRNEFFGEDFYFGELNLKTVIGIGESNRNTNAVEIRFTVIEPYGMTLLNRILAATDLVGQPWNYLANPYLLQIDFFGQDDDGNTYSPISNITKRIPVRITQIKTKITNRGAEYAVQAVPFNHQAYDETTAVVPVAIEVTAETVAGFFKASPDSNAETTVQITQREATRTLPDGTVQPIPSLMIANYKDQVYKARSLGDALNAYFIQLEKTNQVNAANRYDFAFDESIGSSKLFDDIQKNSPKNVPMADLSNAPILRKSTITQKAVDVLDFKQHIFSVQYGTAIDNVISLIIRQSAYIRNQLAIRDNELDDAKYQEKLKQIKDKPLQWFKIVPKIKLLKFDSSTNTFAKKITYNVVPYEMRNIRMDEAPQGKVEKKHAVKFYNYIYTGENIDIIDLNIEFNAAYYITKTAYKTNEMQTSGVDNYYDTGISCEIGDPKLKKTIMPRQFNYRMPDQRSVATGGAKTATDITAADLSASIASQSVADMLHVKLKIVGDPDFIKQDDMFYSLAFNDKGWLAPEEKLVTPNGSIITDRKEVLVQLTFKTPSDIDDNTGLMKYDARFNASGYTGLYRVLTVDSSFEGGKFTQVLDMVRYPDQDDDVNVAMDNRENTVSTGTSDTGATSPIETAPPTTRTTVSGPDILARPGEFPSIGPDFNPFKAVDPGLKSIAASAPSVDISRLPSAGTNNSLNGGATLLGG